MTRPKLEDTYLSLIATFAAAETLASSTAPDADPVAEEVAR